MGQAKRRGSKEERVAQAIALQHQTTKLADAKADAEYESRMRKPAAVALLPAPVEEEPMACAVCGESQDSCFGHSDIPPTVILAEEITKTAAEECEVFTPPPRRRGPIGVLAMAMLLPGIFLSGFGNDRR